MGEGWDWEGLRGRNGAYGGKDGGGGMCVGVCVSRGDEEEEEEEGDVGEESRWEQQSDTLLTLS